MALKVAIIGSGPAGCYTAEKLGKLIPEGEVDVIDRLPTPFGLVRAGVAPDHQGTKNIARVLSRALSKPPAAFFGAVEIDRDVTLAELQELYDAVVIAAGATQDRALDIPGEHLPGVTGSWRFVAWINSHPDFIDHAPDLSGVESVVVIGNGNVAIDVVRMLGKTTEELMASDLSPTVQQALASTNLNEIHMVGRRGAADAKFSPAELAELGELACMAPKLDAAELSPPHPDPKVQETLEAFAARRDSDKAVTLHFDFHLTPQAFLGDHRLESVVFEKTGNGRVEIPAQLCVTCIGYTRPHLDRLVPESGFFANEGGRIEQGLYVVGWAGRGPSGTIATNRPEGHALAEKIVAEVTDSAKPGREGLEAILRARQVFWTDFADWQAIESEEIANAEPGRPRRKFTHLDDMLSCTKIGG